MRDPRSFARMRDARAVDARAAFPAHAHLPDARRALARSRARGASAPPTGRGCWDTRLVHDSSLAPLVSVF